MTENELFMGRSGISLFLDATNENYSAEYRLGLRDKVIEVAKELRTEIIGELLGLDDREEDSDGDDNEAV